MMFSLCVYLVSASVLYLAPGSNGFTITKTSPLLHTSGIRELSSTELFSISETPKNRREAIQIGAASALSTLLVGGTSLPSLADEEDVAPSTKKTILITGGNSGVGFDAAKRLARQGHTLILPCRTLSKSVDAIERIKSSLPSGVGNFLAAECDLASFKSIENFVKKELPSLGSTALDTVCLNAGLCRNVDSKDCARTADGLELTVGTNHFGHFYLNQLLLPMIQPNGGRIVVTASGVHDPESPGGAQGVPATLGNLEGLERDGKNFEMVDGGPFNADKAYKDSKLCNVLFTRELQRRLDSNSATKGITANCFNPGLIVGTGFFREQNPVFTRLFDFAATDLFKVGETPEYGGGCLAYMTNVDSRGMYYASPPGSVKYGDSAYGNQFTITTVSKEAQDDMKAKRLWELSEKIVGFSS